MPLSGGAVALVTSDSRFEALPPDSSPAGLLGHQCATRDAHQEDAPGALESTNLRAAEQFRARGRLPCQRQLVLGCLQLSASSSSCHCKVYASAIQTIHNHSLYYSQDGSNIDRHSRQQRLTTRSIPSHRQARSTCLQHRKRVRHPRPHRRRTWPVIHFSGAISTSRRRAKVNFVAARKRATRRPSLPITTSICWERSAVKVKSGKQNRCPSQLDRRLTDVLSADRISLLPTRSRLRRRRSCKTSSINSSRRVRVEDHCSKALPGLPAINCHWTIRH